MQTNEFLVSVATAIGRDPNTKEGLFIGKSNISSAFTLSMTGTEVRGGINNPLLYTYYHDRKLDIKIESAIYNLKFLGLAAGTLPASTSITYLKSECVTLAANVGTTSVTPVSDINVFLPDGTIQNITPVGKNFTVVNGGSLSVDVTYEATTTANQVVMSTTTPPYIIDLTLIAEVRDNTNTLTKYLQINVPRFAMTGGQTLNFSANGVNNQILEGTALAVYSSNCTTGDYMALIQEIPVAATTVAATEIVALPSTLVFSASNVTGNIKTLAVRGANAVDITTSASYAVTASGSFTTGSHSGIVTSGSAWHAGTTGSVVVSYYDTVSGSTFTDSVNLA